MLDLKSTVVARAGGVPLTLHEFLTGLGQGRPLRELLLCSVAEKRVLAAARAAELTVGDEELQWAADHFRRPHGLHGAKQTRAWLAAEGLTLDDFEAALERDLLAGRFREHLTGPRIEEHFAAGADRNRRARLRQVVVGSEGAARELFAQLHDEGRDFAEVAREHSLHGPSRLAGGSLGVVPRGALPPALADPIFAARAGDVVGPLATEQGFVLFLVEDFLPAELDDETAAAIRAELFDAWLAEQLRGAQIDLGWLDGA
ncbi:MAG TPA: peptidylprolyl isomerase [Gemmataceae bacterium]|nr:peptidylprolyl isomerase [Gemmataceae bacterium]